MRKILNRSFIFVTGGITGYFLKSNKNQNVLNANAASYNNSFTFPISNYQLPNKYGIKVYNNFVVSYNRKTKIPDWVMEVLTPDLVGLPSENSEYRNGLMFEFDETESPLFRSLPSDYTKSGYDRGHMAAAANYKNHEFDCRRSFVMTNISPQVGENFNRGIWNKMEMYVRALVRRSQYVIVCTGPLFLPKKIGMKKIVQYEVIGDNNVAVPTHFFKVILVKEKNSDAFKLFSFILPNIALAVKEDFNLFYVPVKDIERAAGFLIFSQLMGSLKFSQINGEHYSVK